MRRRSRRTSKIKSGTRMRRALRSQRPRSLKPASAGSASGGFSRKQATFSRNSTHRLSAGGRLVLRWMAYASGSSDRQLNLPLPIAQLLNSYESMSSRRNASSTLVAFSSLSNPYHAWSFKRKYRTCLRYPGSMKTDPRYRFPSRSRVTRASGCPTKAE